MNILVAVDGQPDSADAAAVAKEFFGDDHHYIFLSIADFVTSVSTMGVGLSSHVDGLADSIEDHAREVATAAARNHARGTGVTDSEIAIDLGAVGPTICEHALASKADVIVMGSREHSIWDRIFDPSAGRYLPGPRGSVAHRRTRLASRAVAKCGLLFFVRLPRREEHARYANRSNDAEW